MYDSNTGKYVVLSEARKKELEEQQKLKEKELQTLYQKYGKKYVDYYNNNKKILIGTPEGFIKNHMSSSLVRENQTTRTYRISGIIGGGTATVIVNKNTRSVTGVTYNR